MKIRIALVFGISIMLYWSGFASVVSASTPPYERTEVQYEVPDVVLLNQDGQRVRLKSLLESDVPVIVDFIYGTCTTICPVMSAGFSNLQRKLGEPTDRVRLVSITIDPENDTPAILKDYLERYRAKPGWDFLTGSRRDIERVMYAFDAYFRDKMDHQPLNFIRSPGQDTWIRLYGIVSGRDFLKECEKAGIIQ